MSSRISVFRFSALYIGLVACFGWLGASSASANTFGADSALTDLPQAQTAASVSAPVANYAASGDTEVEFIFVLSGSTPFLSGTQIVSVMLDDSAAPITVANFLSYVNSQAYDNSFIHRSIPGFVIQGGGFDFSSPTTISSVTTSAPIQNEFSATRSNLRGTIAMAKVGSDPNSATSQWFFNLADNSGNLDNQNGGFTVFGQVLGDGMQIIDAIAGAPTYNATSLNSAFTNLPLINYTGSLSMNNFVNLQSVQVVSAAVPEPSAFLLMGIGLAGIALVRKRR